MDARYLNAATVLPTQEEVCGRTLRPFCLRHRMCLEAMGSPVLALGEKPITAFDLVVAARVLSTYDYEQMVRPLSFGERWRIWRLTRNRLAFISELAKLIGVMLTSCSYPKFWKKENEGRKAETVPWVLTCVSNLVNHGCSLEEAWTMPEGEAVWMTVANAIADGNKLEVLSTEDEEMMDNFDQIIASHKERTAKN